ncbi:MAG TPA: molybdopterin-dependent oxidoreductase [Pseudonocardia sp.]|nr:molybdopterin-dependent oxidoreductase [Pseudonocardia sp.]
MAKAPAPGRLRRTLAAVVVLAVVTSCATGVPAASAPQPVNPAPVVVEAPVLGPADPVPVPTDPPVLTITGRIGATNGANALSLDPATLDRLGRMRVTVFEPWIKQTMNFQGVWLSDLLELARPDPAARTLHLTALDDYKIDLAVADVRAGGVLLATRTGDGAPIGVEDGGPIRIVYAGGVRAGASADQWIWSLASIDVR